MSAAGLVTSSIFMAGDGYERSYAAIAWVVKGRVPEQ
jgi:hypothetical protein